MSKEKPKLEAWATQWIGYSSVAECEGYDSRVDKDKRIIEMTIRDLHRNPDVRSISEPIRLVEESLLIEARKKLQFLFAAAPPLSSFIQDEDTRQTMIEEMKEIGKFLREAA